MWLAPARVSIAILLPLLSDYRSSSWYWPVVQIIRRLLLVVLQVTLTRGSAQFLAFMLLHSAAGLMHLTVRPFSAPVLNRMEDISICLLLLLSMLLNTYPIATSAPRGFDSLLIVVIVPAFIIMALMVIITAFAHVPRKGTAVCRRKLLAVAPFFCLADGQSDPILSAAPAVTPTLTHNPPDNHSDSQRAHR